MNGKTTSPTIVSDSEILGGTPVFDGTRVPVQNLLDYLSEGHDLDEFLDDFPSVQKRQAQEAILVVGEGAGEAAPLTRLDGARPAFSSADDAPEL